MRTLLTIALAAVLCTGCAFIKPTTEIKLNPLTGTIYILNTKDVDVTATGVKVTKSADGGGTLDIEQLVVSDKSSPVIKENVQQMLAFVEQQKAANEGIEKAMAGIANILSSLVPMVSAVTEAADSILRGSTIAIDTPAGGGSATLGTATTKPGG